MLVEDHYKINRILLKGLGLWPYDGSIWTRVQVVIIMSMFLSIIFVQLAVFVTHECTVDMILEVLSFLFPTLIILFMYALYYFNADVMKRIMEHIYYDWRSFQHKTEITIMNDHVGTMKLIIKVFLFVFFLGGIATLSAYVVPLTFNMFSPLNKSLPLKIYIKVEYFVDPIEYYHLLAIHTMLFITLGMITMIAVGTILLGYLLHACALFKIVNYRMEITMDESVLRAASSKMEHVIYERIVNAVNIHRRAIQYSKILLSCFDKPLLLLIIMSVSSLSICLFRFLKSITKSSDILDIILPFGLVFGHFSCLFFGNHVCQQFTDSNAEIFNTVYNLPWYTAPLTIQKLLLFILRKSVKSFYLSIGGVFDPSHEGFTTLSKAALSYFTVILSLN